MRIQVVVKHGDRVWDSIRATEVNALNRIGQFMAAEDGLEEFVVGVGITNRITSKKPIESIKEWLTSRGYEVIIKELSQGE